LETPCYFFRVLPGVEGRDPKIAFSLRTESCARRYHDLNLFQDLIKYIPALITGRRLDPDVGGVSPAKDLEAGFGKRIGENFGVI
jgi:hypothetical protein